MEIGMISLTKKSRLAKLSERYRSLMDQAVYFKKRGSLKLSFMKMEEAELVAAVMNRIQKTA